MKKNLFQIILLLFLAVVLFGGCNMQNRFLYFPSSEVPSERMLASAGMKFWPKAGGDYRGLTIATDKHAPNGTIVLFHGNGGTASASFDLVVNNIVTAPEHTSTVRTGCDSVTTSFQRHVDRDCADRPIGIVAEIHCRCVEWTCFFSRTSVCTPVRNACRCVLFPEVHQVAE